ncbi:MAG: NupC/NupG family nucleoside CNT transporter, partial [Gemmatimonadetes bacterium]|nr:NupC/NupG family nucleoside CNT transporter [Gemmatimonadota bacterium]
MIRPILALALILAVAWVLSEHRRRISWRLVAWGLGLQVLFALVILRTEAGRWFFRRINDVLQALLRFSEAGSRFIFGDLVFNNIPVGSGQAGSNTPLTLEPGLVANTGAYFAFHVLPTIIFVASLMTVLYHLGIMQRVVGALAWVMRRTMKTTGAETLVAAGNVFVGLMEAPLLAKPFLKRMTRSELMAVMTAGLATVSGSVMAAFVGLLSGYFPDIGGHLVAASVMSAPAALVLAKIMVPEVDDAASGGDGFPQVEREDVNV